MKFEDMINTIQLGNCYELIKSIPDKSIDLVYIDIPYQITNIGAGAWMIKNGAREELYKKKLYDISKGIDYSIFDELCRVMKYIYIYIYGVVKSKC